MNLIEIKEWRASLIASPHTLDRIDALIGMVETAQQRTAKECASIIENWNKCPTDSDGCGDAADCMKYHAAGVRRKYGVTP